MPDPTSVPPARPQFAHLHLHSEYSPLDGANRVDDILTRCREAGMTAVAVTDHGNLSAAVQFAGKAAKAGIKPIFGIEAYVAHDESGRPVPRTARNTPGGEDAKVKTYGHHLVLLAENNTGLKNLFAISSDAFTAGFYGSPRTDLEMLRKHNDGIIAINGHLGSSIAHFLALYLQTSDAKHLDAAREETQWHKQAFGQNEKGEPRFFLELQRYDESHFTDNEIRQSQLNPLIITLANELDIPIVCDNDAHFLTADAWDAHDTLCCISTKKTKVEKELHYPKDLYIKTPEEMALLFPDLPEAVENAAKIAERCNAMIDFGTTYAPVVNPQFGPRIQAILGKPGTLGDQVVQFNGRDVPGSSEWLADFCSEIDFRPVLDGETDPATDLPIDIARVRTQCDLALRLLVEAGLVWRYGSNGITEEIRARLERELKVLSNKKISAYFIIVWDFVNFGRTHGIPCTARGSGVGTMTGYVLGLSNACPVKHGLLFERFTDPEREAYPDIDIDMCKVGRQKVLQHVRSKYKHVAQISAFARLGAKGCLKDVGRVMGLPYGDVEHLCKLVGNGADATLESTMKASPEFAATYRTQPWARQLIDMALKLEGLVRHRSIHAAGLVIANRPLHEICPLATSPRNPEEGVLTQWEGPDCEKVGLLKMDLLGVKTLSIIQLAKDLIRQDFTNAQVWAITSHGAGSCSGTDPLDLERLDCNDPSVLELYRRGETDGIFQFESGGMRQTLVGMKPDRLEDLIAANALYRPGPMEYIPSYTARKHGKEQIPKVHPVVDEVLAETYGVMVYQEQIMQILHRVGGISLRTAYDVIKAISKKKEQEVERARTEFLAGAAKNGIPGEKAQRIFEDILRFAGYGFNKSHATGYAIVSYQTAWLKTFFPAQFMAALLTFEASDGDDNLAPHIAGCKTLRHPSGAVGVPIGVPNINTSGSGFTTRRDADGSHSIILGIGTIKGLGEKATTAILDARDRGGPFKNLKDFVDRMKGHRISKAILESLVKGGAFDSLLEPGDMRSSLLGIPRWTPNEQLMHEKTALGVYLSAHPMDGHAHGLKTLAAHPPSNVCGLKIGASVLVGGLIGDLRIIRDKHGRDMAFITLEDHSGKCNVAVFADAYAKYRDLLNADAVVFVNGKTNFRNDQLGLVADRVTAWDDAPRVLGQCVRIVIDDVEGDVPPQNGELKEILQRHPGAFSIRLDLRQNGVRTGLKTAKTTAAPNWALAREVEALLNATPGRVGQCLWTPA